MKRVRKHISRDLCDGLSPRSDRCILMLRGFGLVPSFCVVFFIICLFWRLCKAFLLCSGERDLWRAPSASVFPKLLTCCSFFSSSKQNSEPCRQCVPSRSSCFSSCLFCFECLIHTRVLFLTSLVARYASFILFFSFSRFLFPLIVGITLSLECALCFFRHRVHSSRLSIYVYIFLFLMR